MKNVTGYDLSKLICGSHGTLAVVDEVTIKTLPRPETSLSLLFGCDDMKSAVAQIAAIFASPHEPGAAAILPQSVAATAGFDIAAAMIAVIRLEGIALSVEDRAMHLRRMGRPNRGGVVDTLPQEASTLWVRSAMLICLQILAETYGNICAPASAPAIVAAIEPFLKRHFMLIGLAGYCGLLGHQENLASLCGPR